MQAARTRNVQKEKISSWLRETEDIMGDFEYSEDGRKVTKCPGGQVKCYNIVVTGVANEI